jgi:hypothetical protein
VREISRVARGSKINSRERMRGGAKTKVAARADELHFPRVRRQFALSAQCVCERESILHSSARVRLSHYNFMLEKLRANACEIMHAHTKTTLCGLCSREMNMRNVESGVRKI